MPTDRTPARTLRDRLAEGMVRAPGVYDGISAHLVRRAGFPAAYFSGAAVAASAFGLPDIGLVTATEMAERLAVVVEACGLPVIADADTGYGTALHVARTVRAYERAGAAAIQLEDQTFPKRCGHLDDKSVVPVEDFLELLRAALDVRDPDTVIVARTDARAPLGLDEALDRGRRYAAEGADVVFVEAPRSRDEVARIAAEIDAPTLFNVVPGGHSPEIADDELVALGIRLVIYPGALVVPALAAARDALRRMGGSPPDGDGGVRDLFRTVGLDEWAAFGRRPGPG